MADKSIRIRLGMEGGKVVESELVGIGNKGSAALGKVTAAADGTSLTVRRMGGAVQNASYQITDFIVQWQGGVSVTQALGQQLPQLLAGFGVMGAVAGLAAASIAPLIRMLSDGSDPVKALTDDLKALDQALAGLRDADAAAGAGVGDLVEKYGQFASQAREVLEIQRQLAEARANRAFNDAAISAADVFGGGLSDFSADELAAVLPKYQEFIALKAEAASKTSELNRLESEYFNGTAEQREALTDSLLSQRAAVEEISNTLFEQEIGLAKYSGSISDLADQFGVAEDSAVRLAIAAAEVREADNTAERVEATRALSQLIYDVSFGMAASKDEAMALYEKLNEALLAGLEFQKLDMRSPIAGAVAETNLLISRLMAANTPTWAVVPKASSGGGGGGGGASDIEKTQKEIDRLNESLLAGASPAAKYRAELAKLDDMKLKGLSDGAYAAGVAKLNAELANSSPWKKFTDAAIDAGAAGENMFEALVKTAKASMVNIVKEIVNAQLGRWLAQSLSGGGSGLGALMGGGSGGGGGLLGALLGGGGGGGGGGLLGGLLGGAAASSAGLAGSGGITGMMAGGMSGGALGGLGAGLASIAGPLAIAALLPGIIGGTKDTDSGYRGTITNGGVDLTKYTDKHTSRLFGLINNSWTETNAAEASVIDPLRKTVVDVQSNIMKMAERLEIGADTFDGFAYKIELSVKGLSESEALAKLQAELAGMGDAFASMITGVKSAQELSAAYGERLDIDRRIMQLQGDELGLQKMELDQTHVLNQERLQEYFNMVNSKKAMEKLNAELGRLSENDYADRLSFDRARGDMVSGLRSVATVSASQAPAAATGAAPAVPALANDVFNRLEAIISRMARHLDVWDLDGLPEVRA